MRVVTIDASTLHGTRHAIFGTVTFVALLAACFVLARRFWGDPAWRDRAVYSMATGILCVMFHVTQDLVNTPDPSAPTGLLQRLSIIVGWSWIALVAFRLMRKQAPIGR